MTNPEITKCPWNLNSYFGRWMYYSWTTSPTLNFVSDKKIENAKQLRLHYILTGTIPDYTTKSQVLDAKRIYENAFHPDTGELQNFFGRLSFVPIGKALLTATLLAQFSKCSSSYIWHGINQSYDSLVNFTHRNGNTSKVGQTRFELYISTATTMSTLAAYHFERLLASKISHPVLYRFIPLTTLSVASIINVPIVRHREIVEGIGIYDCRKNCVGYSKYAAVMAIGETMITRIVMLAPVILLAEFLADELDNRNCKFRKNKWLHSPFKAILCGFILTGMLPTACAIFPQFSSVKCSTLEKYDKEAYNQVKKKFSTIPNKVYFNKGL